MELQAHTLPLSAHAIPGYAEKGWPNDCDMPPVGTLPAYRTDEHKHEDVHMILDVRSGLHVGFFRHRDDAERYRRELRLDWPAAVLMIVDVPASEPWYEEQETVRLDERNLTRVYGHPPMRDVEGLNLDLAKYHRMQVKLLRFFDKRPATPPTWRHLKWIAGRDDSAGDEAIIVPHPDTEVAETWTTGVSREFVVCFRYLFNSNIAERPEK
jgi:hypothetical protein